MKVAIIDYKAGNIRNVQKAVEKFNVVANIVNDGKDLKDYDSIILPGVGSYYHGMKSLISSNFKDTIKEEVLFKNKPFLGICLGMQLMGSRGVEGGSCSGLDLIPFNVKMFDKSKLKLPHIGWNDVKKKNNSKIFNGIPDKSDFYFVHSFYIADIDEKFICGTTNYGINFTSAIEYKNIFGTQFHPEKSQKYGLSLMKNFLAFSSESSRC